MVYLITSDLQGGKMISINVTPDMDSALVLGVDPVQMPMVFFDLEVAEEAAARLRNDQFLGTTDWSVKMFVRIHECEVKQQLFQVGYGDA